MKKVAGCAVFLLVVFALSDTVGYSQSASGINLSTGTIRGRVTQYGNGLSDVVLKAWVPPSVAPPLEGALQTKTDSDGYYLISSLPAGNYYVGVSSAGLVPAHNDKVSGSPRAVSVASGESVSGVDFRLITGGLISGRVTDHAGQPVAGEPIFLREVKAQLNPTVSMINPAMTKFSSGLFRTDQSGTYQVDGIPPGSYVVQVGTPLFGAFKGRPPREPIYYPGTSDRSKARTIEVSEAALISGVDIKLGPTIPTFTVRGRVVDTESGNPISGISLDLKMESPTGGFVIPSAGKSDEGGEFSLERLPAARYSVAITESRTDPKSEVFGESSAFEIRDTDVTNIEVRASKTVEVSGVVVVENTNDKSILAKVSQLNFIFEINPKAGGAHFYRTAKTAANLGFSLRGLKPGKLRIHINDDALATEAGLRFGRMELGPGNPVREIEIGPDIKTTGLQVVLTYGSGTVRGQVKIENGPLPALLRVYAHVRDDKGFRGGMWVDATGNFLIEALPPGDYTVVATAGEPGKRNVGPEVTQSISIGERQSGYALLILDAAAIRAAMK